MADAKKLKSEDGQSFSVGYEQHHVDESRHNVSLDGKHAGYVVEGEDDVRAFVDPAALGAGFGVARDLGTFKDRKEATQAIVDAIAPPTSE